MIFTRFASRLSLLSILACLLAATAQATPVVKPGECLFSLTWRAADGTTSGSIELNEDSGEGEFSTTTGNETSAGKFQATPSSKFPPSSSYRVFEVSYRSISVDIDSGLGYAWSSDGPQWIFSAGGQYDIVGPGGSEPFLIEGDGWGDMYSGKGATGRGQLSFMRNGARCSQKIKITSIARRCKDTVPPNLGESSDEEAEQPGTNIERVEFE